MLKEPLSAGTCADSQLAAAGDAAWKRQTERESRRALSRLESQDIGVPSFSCPPWLLSPSEDSGSGEGLSALSAFILIIQSWSCLDKTGSAVRRGETGAETVITRNLGRAWVISAKHFQNPDWPFPVIRSQFQAENVCVFVLRLLVVPTKQGTRTATP